MIQESTGFKGLQNEIEHPGYNLKLADLCRMTRGEFLGASAQLVDALCAGFM